MKQLIMMIYSIVLLKLDASKLIVTACPHNIRANIAIHYLKTKGFNVKLLTNGLTGLMSNLLSGNAKKMYKFINH